MTPPSLGTGKKKQTTSLAQPGTALGASLAVHPIPASIPPTLQLVLSSSRGSQGETWHDKM